MRKMTGTMGWAVAMALVLAACSPSRVWVEKADMEAANQCLMAQQERQEVLARQQTQLAETLSLLRASIELQQQGDQTLRDFLKTARQGVDDGRRQVDCPERSAERSDNGVDKQLVGATERVLLTDLNIVLPARIDTGATGSSLDAREVERFERDGEQWVRFKLAQPEGDELLELERPRTGESEGSGGDKSPMVEMRISIGSTTQTAAFALVDRREREHPLLVGRNVLRDLMLVDVGRANVTEPDSPDPAPAPETDDEPGDADGDTQ